MDDMRSDEKDVADGKDSIQQMVEFYETDDDPEWIEEQRMLLDFGRRCMRQIHVGLTQLCVVGFLTRDT